MFSVARSARIVMLLVVHAGIIAEQPIISASTGSRSSNAKRAAGRRDPDPARQLDTYLQKLKETPDDLSLRRVIIRFVATMKSLPEIPDEARRHFMTAMGMMKVTTTPEGAALAAAEYQQALVLAPWWGDAYLHESEALQLEKRYPEAIEALTLYILADPQNAREAQNRIYQLQGEQKIAARQDEKGRDEQQVNETHQAMQVGAEAKSKSPDDLFIRGLDGVLYGWRRETSSVHQSATFEIRGHNVILRWEENRLDDNGGSSILREQFPIVGRNFFRNDQHSCSIIFSGAQHCRCKYTIETDAIEAMVILDGKEMPLLGASFGICRGPNVIPRKGEPR